MNSIPNVVIIMTDQQRADLCKKEGYALDTTPFMDAFSQQGTWFNRSYTTMPACAPARVSMLTGRYPSATRVRTNHNIEDATYSKDLFQIFREQGYRTALSGKNHSHLTKQDCDFWYEASHLTAEDNPSKEEYRSFEDFMKKTHFHMSLEATPFPLECQYAYRIVDHAKDWIASLEDHPFMLWMSFPEPHNPYQVPEPYYSLFPPESLPPLHADESALAVKGFPYQWCRQSFIAAFPDFAKTIDRARANYLGMLRMIDDQVKRFVDFLESQNLKESTLFVILADHGDFVGEYGLMRKGPELPEALTRMPLSFIGSSIQNNKAAHQAHVSMADILPTLCHAIGATIPEGVQGRSLWPLLTGLDYPEQEFSSVYAEHGFGGLAYTAEEKLDPQLDNRIPSPDGEHWGKYDCLNSWTQSGQSRMVRKGDWKLIMDMQGNGQLYHLVEDPAEVVNLFSNRNHAAIQQELLIELMAWTLKAQDPLPIPRKRYVMKKDPHNYWSEGAL